MRPYWIDSHDVRLGIAARPRGGDWLEDECRSLSRDGVEVLVSCLEPDEVAELQLVEEPSFAAAAGLEFIGFPLPDRGVPGDQAAFRALIDRLEALARAGRRIVIHCRMGIGRSSLVAAAILVRFGVSLADAFERLTACRGFSVPDTAEQRAWLETR